MARVVMHAVGVETGGSNVQFAVNPADGRVLVIEMNPRVSRSSALASKATGFPIAKLAALVAVGYTLDELRNDITRTTVAAFEPSIDYVVTKLPRWAFEKFPGVDPTLGPQMKSVGEAMAIGRTFKESLLKGLRSLELSPPALSHAGMCRLGWAARAAWPSRAPSGSGRCGKRCAPGIRPTSLAPPARSIPGLSRRWPRSWRWNRQIARVRVAGRAAGRSAARRQTMGFSDGHIAWLLRIASRIVLRARGGLHRRRG